MLFLLFFTNCVENENFKNQHQNELSYESLKIGAFHINDSFSHKAHSSRNGLFFAYATNNYVEVFDSKTGKSIFKHNLKEVFDEPVKEIFSFCLDSVNYVIQTREKLFVFNQQFYTVDVGKWEREGMILSNLNYPAFSSKSNTFCANIIDYRDVEDRGFLYDYKYIAIIDLITEEMKILDIKHPLIMRTLQGQIIPFVHITYGSEYYVVSNGIEDSVFLVNENTFEAKAIAVESMFGNKTSLMISDNSKSSKSSNQEYGFQYLKAWFCKETNNIYRLVKLHRPVRFIDGKFTTENNQPYSILNVNLNNEQVKEALIPQTNIQSINELFFYENKICHKSDYVLSKADTSWSFIFSCYSFNEFL